MKRKHLSVFFIFLLTVCVFGLFACSDNNDSNIDNDDNIDVDSTVATAIIEYRLSDDGSYYAVTGVKFKDVSVLEIPSSYNNKIVKQIDDNAFQSCINLTSISIPESVEIIGKQVFKDCFKLKYNTYNNAKYLGNKDNPYLCLIEVDDSLKSFGVAKTTKVIYENAFKDCFVLESVTLPNTIKSSGYSSFVDCISLYNTNYIGTIDDWAMINFFDETSIPAGKLNVLYNNTSLNIRGETEITISKATCINDYTFYFFPCLESINIENSVKSIGKKAFARCIELKKVNMSNGVNKIDSYAFNDCQSLTTVNISTSLKEIGNGAFNDCSRLTNITIPNGVISIGETAFNGCTSLEEISIPSSVTSIGNRAFYLCTKLQNITVDNKNSNYSSKDGVLFSKDKKTLICCPNKSGTYEIPSGVKEIATEAFYGCNKLTGVIISNSVETIGQYAFGYCTHISSIVIPNSVTTIYPQSFGGSGLTSAIFENKNNWWSGNTPIGSGLNNTYAAANALKSNEKLTRKAN